MHLPPGYFVALGADQLSCDIVVDVLTRDGRKLYEVDSPMGRRGRERIFLLGEAGGAGKLVVRLAGPQARCTYRLVVEAVRQATFRDRQRVAAEQAFAQAEELRRRRDGTSLSSALAKYRATLSLFGKLGDQARQADSYDRLGRVHIDFGQNDEALVAYLQALALLPATGRVDLRGAVLDGIGRAYDGLGEPESALASYTEALKLHRSYGDAVRVAKSLNNLGRLYTNLGEFALAAEAYDEALGEVRSLGDRETEGVILSSLALLQLKLGEPQRALDLLERALPLLRTENHERLVAVALENCGMARAQLGQPAEAIEALNEALAIKRRLGDRREEAVTLNNLAAIQHSLGRMASVREAYGQVLDIAAQLKDHTLELTALLNLSWLDVGTGRIAAALGSFQRASQLASTSGDRNAAASATMGISLAERRLGNLPAAQSAAEEALSYVESLRGAVPSTGLRSSFLATKSDYYRSLVDLLMERHRQQPGGGFAAAALEVDERSRARSLLDELALGDKRRTRAARASRLTELSQRIRDAKRRLDGAGPAEAAAAERDLRALIAARHSFSDDRDSANEGQPRLEMARPLRFAEIQRLVSAGDTVLLQYSLGLERSFVWVVSAQELTVRELPARAEIERQARDAYLLLTTHEQSAVRSALRDSLATLSATLLAPVAADLAPAKRIAVVADAALYLVPFAVLPVPGQEVECLLDRHEIVVLPSSSSLAVLRARNRASDGTLAVVADPVFDQSDPRLKGTQAREAPELHPGEPSGFPRLASSAIEGQAILRLVPPDRRVAAFGFTASRALVHDARFTGASMLHFATHAVVDTQNPDLSGLALSAYDERGNRQDGFLFAYEIHDLDLAADLVVLSACETARGKTVNGEGAMSLSRAFFVAGAHRLLVSLWPVDDQATAALMEEFYRALLWRGRSATEALREAQLAIRGQPTWQDPYFWAGFELQGDWR